jgi:hypothetical protein
MLWPAAVLVVVAASFVLAGLDRSDTDEREATPAGRGSGTEPVAARDFADSVGINVHLTYTSTPYGDIERVLASLRELGVGHVRDGVVVDHPEQEERLNQLADAGIRSTLIMGAPNLGSPADEVEMVKRNLRVVEALEGPNEYDVSGDGDWRSALLRYQRDLYRRVKDDPALRDLDVYGPTVAVTGNLTALGDFRGVMDAANMHPYPGGGAPEPALAEGYATLEQATGMSEVVATETGYHNARGDHAHPAADEAVAGDYLPRMFLSAYADGYRRTYWYELVDVGADPDKPESNFGLLRADFEPKPAFTALRNLMHLVSDDSGGDAELRPLRLSISPAREDVRQLLLQKADGSYLLALWREADLSEDAAEPARLRVDLPQPAAEARVYRPSRSADPEERLRDVSEVDVALAGDAIVVHLVP